MSWSSVSDGLKPPCLRDDIEASNLILLGSRLCYRRLDELVVRIRRPDAVEWDDIEASN
jgi:hypothetical protein